MATTQETTITDLELAEEVLGDMVLAVDTSTDTKSISLKQLKTYLGSNLPTGFILPAVGRTDDKRFTLLDGKTLAKSGTYAEFCAKVEEQVSAGNWFSCTEEEFNADVSKYGQCGRFVITSEYVRIPKITRFLGATVTLSEIGKTYAESLPNITGSFGGVNGNLDPTGAFYVDTTKKNAYRPATPASDVSYLGFDSSRSSSTYQDEAKVQPDHTKYPYYMVVSTEGQSAPIEVDINKVYEDLELKANSNLSNVPSNIDYVVESWTDGLSFYRKYKSGWLEQGKFSETINSAANQPYTFTLIRPFKYTNAYEVNITSFGTDDTTTGPNITLTARNTTSVTIVNQGFDTGGNHRSFNWYACGRGA